MIFKTSLPAKNGQLPRGGVPFHLPQGSWNEQPPCGQAPTCHPVPANLAQHVRRIHPAPGVEPKTFPCPIILCGTRSDSLADQKKHLRGPHGLFPCPVPKCKEVQFRTALEMQHHQQTVHGSVALPALPAPPAPVAPVAQMAPPAPALPAHAAPVAQMTTPVAPVAQMTTPAPALPAHAAPVAQMTTPVAPVAQMTTSAVSSTSLAPSFLVTTPISFTCPWPECEHRTRSEPAMKEHLETTHGGKSYPADAKDDSHDNSQQEQGQAVRFKGITPDGRGSGSVEGDVDMADA
ncbi:hypothetical protein LZ554_000346 [Drepanopeziza brunnea f. sp. 'monogermtubi']|nr:hypothetical protein LZ554_000346 [Drepanopeziza brunnea f. sp. 'monogermtubi']